MELELVRNIFTDKSTIGNLFINGEPFCYILEDKDRGLTESMDLEEIERAKVYSETAIPYGKYEVIVTKSARFSKLAGHDVYLPLLLNVRGFDGIRIHSGNRAEDSEGCLLPGMNKDDDFVSNSRTAFVKLNEKINDTLKTGEKVWITIKKSGL